MKHCATLRTLPSSSPYLVLVVVFALGALLFGVGGALKRRSAAITWTRLLDDTASTYDLRTRIEMIERLGIVAQEWCRPILAQAALEEHDRAATAAIAAARARLP
ncbi:MAG: hypothetical protein ABI182_00325 [Candidatus Baltobacteraceae bacterium]